MNSRSIYERVSCHRNSSGFSYFVKRKNASLLGCLIAVTLASLQQLVRFVASLPVLTPVITALSCTFKQHPIISPAFFPPRNAAAFLTRGFFFENVTSLFSCSFEAPWLSCPRRLTRTPGPEGGAVIGSDSEDPGCVWLSAIIKCHQTRGSVCSDICLIWCLLLSTESRLCSTIL